jgi:hypothetical protein
MKAYPLFALLAALGSLTNGMVASAQAIPEEWRRSFQDRREERERGDEVREMFRLHRACNDGERRACIQFGMIIGKNGENRAQWRLEHPELFGWER